MAITAFNIPQANQISFTPLGTLYHSLNYDSGAGFTIPPGAGEENEGIMTINFSALNNVRLNDPTPERPVYIFVNDSNSPHLLEQGGYMFTLLEATRDGDDNVTSINILYDADLTRERRGAARTLAQFIADLGTPPDNSFLNIHEQDGILGTSSTRISTGGFVQAIYNADNLATNAEKDGLSVMIAPANGRATSYRLQQGVAVPTDAHIINASADTFTLLINH